MIQRLRGNRTILKYQLKMDGSLVSTLVDATRIVFAVKEDRDDVDSDSVIFLEWNTGDIETTIKRNDPEDGWVRVELNSSTMSISPRKYYFALQVEWGSDNRQEFIYGDGILEIRPDVIR